MSKKTISLIIISLIVISFLAINEIYFINKKDILKGGSVSRTTTPSSSSAIDKVIEDESGLVGISIEKKGEKLIISGLLEGKPAEQSGLMVGDEIIEIDGKSAENISVEEATQLIRGEPGTGVVLLIHRDGKEKYQEFKIKRVAFRKLPSRICQDVDRLSKIPETELAELNNLPKFYPTVSWEQVPLDQQSDFGKIAIWLQLGNIIFDSPELCGQEWSAQRDASTIEETNSFEDSFYQYYDTEFSKRGWKWRIDVKGFEITGAAADGPDGSTWGYLKAIENGLRAVVLSEHVSDKRIEFRIFFSDIIPLGEIIP